jgi:hypothetical protein
MTEIRPMRALDLDAVVGVFARAFEMAFPSELERERWRGRLAHATRGA